MAGLLAVMAANAGTEAGTVCTGKGGWTDTENGKMVEKRKKGVARGHAVRLTLAALH